MFYNIKRKLLTILGDIRWFGWQNPFWFARNVPTHKIRGEHYRQIKAIIQPGDVLLRGFEGYVDGWFIPGQWSHAAIYVGDNQVIHAMAEGVFVEDILNFMRTDRMAIYRPPFSLVGNALVKAQEILGAEYDFEFDMGDSKKFYCSEVVDYCYPGLLKPTKYLWRTVVAPDDITRCDDFVEIWNSETSISAFSVSTRKILKKN